MVVTVHCDFQFISGMVWVGQIVEGFKCCMNVANDHLFVEFDVLKKKKNQYNQCYFSIPKILP